MRILLDCQVCEIRIEIENVERDVVDGDREEVRPFRGEFDSVDLLADALVRDHGLVATPDVEHLNRAGLLKNIDLNKSARIYSWKSQSTTCISPGWHGKGT